MIGLSQRRFDLFGFCITNDIENHVHSICHNKTKKAQKIFHLKALLSSNLILQYEFSYL